MKKTIEQTLNVLKSMQLNDIGRAVTLEWFVFSSEKNRESNMGSEHSNPEYTIHVECAWRISGSEGIVVASRDRYYPAGNTLYKTPENFNWDIPGSNRCDQRATSFIKSKLDEPLIVLALEVDEIGSLRINLSNGYKLEIFPDDSLGKEFWRFFQLDSETRHFVVTGNGIE